MIISAPLCGSVNRQAVKLALFIHFPANINTANFCHFRHSLFRSCMAALVAVFVAVPNCTWPTDVAVHTQVNTLPPSAHDRCVRALFPLFCATSTSIKIQYIKLFHVNTSTPGGPLLGAQPAPTSDSSYIAMARPQRMLPATKHAAEGRTPGQSMHPDHHKALAQWAFGCSSKQFFYYCMHMTSCYLCIYSGDKGSKRKKA